MTVRDLAVSVPTVHRTASRARVVFAALGVVGQTVGPHRPERSGGRVRCGHAGSRRGSAAGARPHSSLIERSSPSGTDSAVQWELASEDLLQRGKRWFLRSAVRLVGPPVGVPLRVSAGPGDSHLPGSEPMRLLVQTDRLSLARPETARWDGPRELGGRCHSRPGQGRRTHTQDRRSSGRAEQSARPGQRRRRCVGYGFAAVARGREPLLRPPRCQLSR